MSKKTISLSKSQFTRGLQCHKALWLYKNRPELRQEPDAATEALFEIGYEVGGLAQQLFPGGTLIEFDREKFEEKIEETQAAIDGGEETIYEATFRYDDVLVMVDILHKGTRGWELYEVKSSTAVKEYHIPDAAVQYYVLQGAGLKIARAAIVHLNREYVRQGDIKARKLFTISEVTDKLEDLKDFIRAELKKQRKMLEKGMPDIDIGPQCSDPFDCDFSGHCWEHIPDDSVFGLRERGVDKFALYRQGIVKQKDIPLDILNAKQRFQVESTLKKRDKLDKEKVQAFLDSLWYPLCYLDFETFRSPVPKFDFSRPYDQIPFQYAVYLQTRPGEAPKHNEFLAEPGEDPREELLNSLLAVIPKGACIVAYNASFEIGRLRELGEQYTRHRARINAMIDSFVDLMQPFKNRHLYRWQVKGSYSLKQVLPALVPSLTYEGMEISDGGMAEQAFLQMNATTDAAVRKRLRKALLAYCKQDTLGMVKIVEKMRAMVKGK